MFFLKNYFLSYLDILQVYVFANRYFKYDQEV